VPRSTSVLIVAVTRLSRSDDSPTSSGLSARGNPNVVIALFPESAQTRPNYRLSGDGSPLIAFRLQISNSVRRH
jgi:hypothetical protein